MTFHFPKLATVEPLLAAIIDMPEINVNEDHENGLGVVMYNVAFEETFLNPFATDDPAERARRILLREARGIKFDLKTKRIVSRPYHKFFNVNERDETQAHVIDWTQPHVILEKLDGSMLTPYVSPSGEIKWMTKRGVTEVANNALDFFHKHPHYEDFCRRMFNKNLTPIFEWCTRRQRIIVDYGPTDRMVLTAIRDNVSGDYFRYDDMVGIARDNNLDYVRKLDFTVTNVNEFLQQTREIEGEEGYIVRFDTGHMYKVKGEWYCRLHKTFDALRFEKDIIRLILEGQLDDLRPFLIPTMLSAVDLFAHDIRVGLRSNALAIVDYANKYRGNTTKFDFVKLVQADAQMQPFNTHVFRAFDRDLNVDEVFEQLVFNVLKKSYTQTQVDEIRFLFGGKNWYDYTSMPTE